MQDSLSSLSAAKGFSMRFSQAEIVEITFVFSCFSDILKEMTLFNDQKRHSFSVVSAQKCLDMTRNEPITSICWVY